MHRTIALFIAAMPAVAWANEAPMRASLEVDADAAGEGHDVIERRIDERGAVVLRDAGILPAQSRNDPSIHVAIAEVGTANPGYHYRVSIPGDDWSSEGTCALCTEGELVEVIEGAIGEAASHLPRHASEAPATTPTPLHASDASDRGKLRAMGKAGIGLIVSGTLVAGVGIGLAVAQPRVNDDAPLEKTTTRPPGYALIGIGAAALVTGVVLLAVDRKRAKRTAVVPTIGPRTAGFVLTTRF